MKFKTIQAVINYMKSKEYPCFINVELVNNLTIDEVINYLEKNINEDPFYPWILANYFLNEFGLVQDWPRYYKYLKIAADNGLAIAKYELGGLLLYGHNKIPLEKDLDEAYKQNKSAADNNYLEAVLYMASYFFGIGDLEQSFYYYEKAIGLGSKEPFSFYKDYYYKVNNLNESFRWHLRINNLDYNIEKPYDEYIKKAKNNDSFAKYILGYYYYDTHVSNEDEYKFIHYFEESALLGNKDAKGIMGYYYVNGSKHFVIKKDMRKGLEYLTDAAISGNVEAMNDLYRFYLKGKKTYNKGIYWLKECAKLNDEIAIFELARVYYNGLYNVKKDYKKAYRLLIKKSNNWNIIGPYMMLSRMYLRGHGVRKDYNKALEYIYECAKKDDLGYWMGDLGNCYLYGYGVKKDASIALTWFVKQAKEKYNEKGWYNIGRLYYYGIGLEKNYDKALAYFKASIIGGLEDRSANRFIRNIIKYKENNNEAIVNINAREDIKSL